MRIQRRVIIYNVRVDYDFIFGDNFEFLHILCIFDLERIFYKFWPYCVALCINANIDIMASYRMYNGIIEDGYK